MARVTRVLLLLVTAIALTISSSINSKTALSFGPSPSPHVIVLSSPLLGVSAGRGLRITPSISSKRTCTRVASGTVTTLRFPEPAQGVRAVQVGDILISGVTPQSPCGLLQKITTVQKRTPAEVVVQTQQATLAEAIQQALRDKLLQHGSFTVSTAPLPVSEQETGKRVRPIKLCPPKWFKTRMPNTGNPSIMIQSRACVTFEFTLRAAFSLLPPSADLTFSASAHGQARGDVNAQDSFQHLQKNAEVWSLLLAPIQIMVGPLPIVIVPRVAIQAGANGHIQILLNWGAMARMKAATQLSCTTNRGCSPPTRIFDMCFSTPELSAQGDAGVRGYSGPHLALLFYGVAGPEFGVETYVDAQVTQVAPPRWSLAAGLQGVVQLAFKPLGISSGRYVLAASAPLQIASDREPYGRKVLVQCSLP